MGRTEERGSKESNRINAKTFENLYKRLPMQTHSTQTSQITIKEHLIDDIDSLVEKICSSAKLHPITARVLASRNIVTKEEISQFLYPSFKHHLPDPMTIKNMSDAAEHIIEAVESDQMMVVYSDFDVDGLTSGSQLVLFLRAIGARVSGFVPNRFTDGYGLSVGAIKRLADAGHTLLVTVDCGISNHNEISYAKRLGMSTVVLDHHQPGETLPPADVVVDPAQEGCPFQEYKLAAAGLVWMLIVVLRSKLEERGVKDVPHPKEFLDLAAMGTICDMVPLRTLNRLIALRGIEALKTKSRVGIDALKTVAGVSNTRLSSGSIGFNLGPRINAAGRLGDANDILRLLTTDDKDEAETIAQKVDNLNRERQAVELRVKESCLSILEEDEKLLENNAIAIFGEDYHLGVIGIAAQRLVEAYHKPAAVMAPATIEVDGEEIAVAKGSVRSISGFHVSEVLGRLNHLLLSHGGHAAAGGFTVAMEQLETFQEAFINEGNTHLTAEMLTKKISADCCINLNDITFDFVEEITRLAPFGVGNPSPIFITENVTIERVDLLSQKHLKLKLSDKKCQRNALAWNSYGNPLLRKGTVVNIAYQVDINLYQGVSSVQLTIKDVWH